MATCLSIFVFISLLAATVVSCNESTAYDVLESNGLPKGLLPDSVKHYTIPAKGEGEFNIKLGTQCLVKFGEIDIFFDTSITGILTYGSFKNISGIDVGKLFLWLPVEDITLNSNKTELAINLELFSLNFAVKEFKTIPICKSYVSRKNKLFSSK